MIYKFECFTNFGGSTSHFCKPDMQGKRKILSRTELEVERGCGHQTLDIILSHG